MLYIKLQGGLGNQMFQYAFGRALSERSGIAFKLDTTLYTKLGGAYAGDTPRTYLLDNFSVQVDIATANELRQFPQISSSRIIRKLFSFSKKYITESTYSKDLALDPKQDLYFAGFWQNESFFKEYRQLILKDLTLRPEKFSKVAQEMSETIKQAEGSIAIHIRRGDYISNALAVLHHPVAPLQYYEKATAKMTELYPNASFFVFSDDIVYAKENLKSARPMTFVSSPNLSESEELYLMSLCKHQIIANSSFSWWAAWLNQNHSKTVIAPLQWFKDPSLGTDIVPSEWLKI